MDACHERKRRGGRLKLLGSMNQGSDKHGNQNRATHRRGQMQELLEHTGEALRLRRVTPSLLSEHGREIDRYKMVYSLVWRPDIGALRTSAILPHLAS